MDFFVVFKLSRNLEGKNKTSVHRRHVVVVKFLSEKITKEIIP